MKKKCKKRSIYCSRCGKLFTRTDYQIEMGHKQCYPCINRTQKKEAEMMRGTLPREAYINFPFLTATHERKCALCRDVIHVGMSMFDGGPGKAVHTGCAYGMPRMPQPAQDVREKWSYTKVREEIIRELGAKCCLCGNRAKMFISTRESANLPGTLGGSARLRIYRRMMQDSPGSVILMCAICNHRHVNKMNKRRIRKEMARGKNTRRKTG